MNGHKLGWCVILGLLAWIARSAAADELGFDRDNAYRASQFGELPVEFPIVLANSQIMVDGVYVNDQGPFRFLLDTGAMGAGRVDASLVEKLGLASVGEVQGGDGSGRTGPAMPIYDLNRLRLGPLEYRDVRVTSRDYNLHGSAARGHIDGILGIALFRDLLLTIDYPGRALRIEQAALPEGCDDRVALQPDGEVPTLSVSVGGHTVAAHIDSGAMGGITLGGELLTKVAFKAEPVVVGEARTVTGPFSIKEATLDGELRIGNTQLRDPQVTLAEPMPGVNLGGRFLMDYVVTIDQARNRARLLPESKASQTIRRNALGEVVERLPLELVMGRPVVAAKIDGKGPFRFVLDTGATICLLYPDLVKEADLPISGTTRVGDPASPEAHEVDTQTLSSLALGKVVSKQVEAVAWGDDQIQQHLGDVRGVIGVNTFAEYLITFDFDRGELILSRGHLAEGDGSVTYELDDSDLLRVQLTVAGEIVESHIDTGNARELSLPLRMLDKVRRDGEVGHARMRTASGEFDISIATLDESIRVGGVTIAHPEVSFLERFDWGNIGTGLLSRYVMTIDQTRRRIRLVPSGSSSRASSGPERVVRRQVVDGSKNRRRYGFMLSVTPGGPWTINGTMPGSIAASAGLKAGDRIVRVNGVDFEGLDKRERGDALRQSPLTLVVDRDGTEVEFKMSLDDAVDD